MEQIPEYLPILTGKWFSLKLYGKNIHHHMALRPGQ